MSKVPASKTIYCAQCRLEQAHTMTLDKNNEINATCATCGRNLKFPLVGAGELAILFAKHKESSSGQITVEMAEKDQAIHDAAFFESMGIK